MTFAYDEAIEFLAGADLGENVIYLGGSISENLATFKQEAYFWGHGVNTSTNNIMKLGPMMDRLTGVFHWEQLEIISQRKESEFPTDFPE